MVEVLVEAGTEAEASELATSEENWYDVVDEYPVMDEGQFEYEVVKVEAYRREE